MADDETRVSLDFEPKPDAADVPHRVTLFVDGQHVSDGHGNSDIEALRDLLVTIGVMANVNHTVFGSVCSSFRAALTRLGAR